MASEEDKYAVTEAAKNESHDDDDSSDEDITPAPTGETNEDEEDTSIKHDQDIANLEKDEDASAGSNASSLAPPPEADEAPDDEEEEAKKDPDAVADDDDDADGKADAKTEEGKDEEDMQQTPDDEEKGEHDESKVTDEGDDEPPLEEEKGEEPTELESKTLKNDPSNKTKIEYRLVKAVEDALVTKDMSPELIPLTAGYNKMKKRFRTLILSAKQYNEAIVKLETARAEFIKQIELLSEDTPLNEHIAKPLDADLAASLKELVDEEEVKPKFPQLRFIKKNNPDEDKIQKLGFEAPEKKPIDEDNEGEGDEGEKKEQDEEAKGDDDKGGDEEGIKTEVKDGAAAAEKPKTVADVVNDWKWATVPVEKLEKKKTEDEDDVETATKMDGDNVDEGIEVQIEEKPPKAREFESLAAMNEVSSAHTKESLKEFQEKVLEYSVEWEKAVVTRVDTKLKEVKQLERSLQHYDKKLGVLKKKVSTIEAKGKQIKDTDSERVERNEEKLQSATKNHEIGVGKLYALLYEVIVGGWKDLYYLARNTIQLESDRVNRDHEVYKNLSSTLERMEAAFKETDPQTFEDLAK